MRPVDRVATPTNAAGEDKQFADYQDARSDLYDRLGRYCSFCERRIVAGLAVEHIHHKKKYPQFETTWSNFLLACINCNSTKGTKEVKRKQMLFPDQDNTFFALLYLVGGRIIPGHLLTPSLKSKATRLLKLVGLDKLPATEPQAKDMRWNDRREAWDKATRYRNAFVAKQISVSHIADLCRLDGHWSIWMTVFAPHPTVRQALLTLVPGIPNGCFTAAGLAQQRPGGQI